MKNNTYQPVLGFWSNLPRPFYALAPMADVTDIAFRKLVAKHSRHGKIDGGPDIFWTEFVSTDGLVSSGREALIRDLEFTSSEQPIVAQIFGATPENFRKIAIQCEEFGFAGIDINMGCPDRSVCKQGAGAALITTPKLAQEVVLACQAGAPNTPISVKTRIGWQKDETDTWIKAILETKPAVVTIHARTQKDMSKSNPKWEAVKRAVEIRNVLSPNTLIMANGGIRTHTQGQEIVDFTGCDGIMMGKAVFGNPWLFDKTKKPIDITIGEKLKVLIEHAQIFMEEMGDIGVGTNKPELSFGKKSYTMKEMVPGKNFSILKKHFKAYCHGFPGAKELRINLMDASSLEDITELIRNWLTVNEKLAATAPTEEYIV